MVGATQTAKSQDGGPARSVIRLDTGAFAHGHISFTRYSTPGLCVAAARTAAEMSRAPRSIQRSTERFRQTTQHDSLPAEAIAVARTCGRRFTIANTVPDQLASLFLLALSQNDDALASAVAVRRLALASNQSQRDSVRFETIAQYLAAEPARIDLADAFVARLEREGKDADAARAVAYAQLLAYDSATFNRQRLRRDAERAIAFYDTFSAAQLRSDTTARTSIAIEPAYRALAMLAYVDAPDSLPGVAGRARSDLQRRYRVPGTNRDSWYDGENTDTIVAHLLPDGAILQSVHDTIVAPIRGAYVFPAQADTGAPTSERISIVLNGRWAGTSNDDCLNRYQPIFTTTDCIRAFDQFRTWIQKYSDIGLSATVVVGTRGYVLLSSPQTVEQEALALRHFFQRRLSIPARVVVQHSLSDTMPDGRIFHRDPPFVAANHPPLLIVGRDHRLLYAGNVSPVADALLQRLFSSAP